MPYRTIAVIIVAIMGFFFVVVGPAAAQQQASLGNISNATVTLYYYDNMNGTKGEIVPMIDNPQHVNWDPALAAPGTYTFSHVPAGQWYYLEADNNGDKWYNIFYMGENLGTKTANVAIPPSDAANASWEMTTTPTPTTTAVPAVSNPVPTRNEGPNRPTPAMTITSALLAIAITLLTIHKRN